MEKAARRLRGILAFQGTFLRGWVDQNSLRVLPSFPYPTALESWPENQTVQ